MPVLASLVGLVALQGGWESYPVGSFAVDFPAKPQVKGKGGEREVWLAPHPNGTVVHAGILSPKAVGPQTPDEAIADFLDGFLQRSRLSHQEDMVVDGWPALDYLAVNPDGTLIFGRTIAAKGHLITLFGMGRSKAVIEPSLRMFGSLRFPKGFGKGKLAQAGPQWSRHLVGETGASVEFPRTPEDVAIPLKVAPDAFSRETSATIINRTYSVQYIALPILVDATEEQEDEILRASSESAARILGPKPSPPEKVKLGGSNAWRTTVQSKDGKTVLRLETLRRGKWLLRFASHVPTCLAKSPEGDRFFASAKFD